MCGRAEFVKDIRPASDFPQQEALLAGQAGSVPQPVFPKERWVMDGREEGDSAGGGGGGDLKVGGHGGEQGVAGQWGGETTVACQGCLLYGQRVE